MMIVHIMRMYHSKHPHKWDESLPYAQNGRNRALHGSIVQNPLQVYFRFQQLAPIDVALPRRQIC
jgi:hypothetical protein